MINARRFQRFEKTNLFLNFGEVLDYNIDLVDIGELEYYKNI